MATSIESNKNFRKVIELNESYIVTKIKDTDNFLKYLVSEKNYGLTNEIKKKLSHLNEKLDNLLMFLEAGNHVKNCEKIDANLWNDNFLLKFLFEDYIEYKKFVSQPELLSQLYCNICQIHFLCNSKNLFLHLSDETHLGNFDKVKLKYLSDDNTVWSNSLQKLLFEKYIIFKQWNNLLYCKLCCVDFNCSSHCLTEHVESSSHVKYFKDIISFDESDPTDKIITSVEESLKNCHSPAEEELIGNLVENKKSMDDQFLSEFVIKGHAEFMVNLYISSSRNQYNPIFCQLCCHFQCTFDLIKGAPDKLKHVNTFLHKTMLSNLNSSELINFNWYYCQKCHSNLYCNGSLKDYHNKHDFHQLIVQLPAANETIRGDSKDFLFTCVNDNSIQKEPIGSDYNLLSSHQNSLHQQEENKLGLLNNMKLLLQYQLKNPDKFLSVSKYFGFYCNCCNYWCNDEKIWWRHMKNSEIHKYNVSIKKGNIENYCDCNIIIFCDNIFFDEHKSSVEHSKLNCIFVKKFATTDSNKVNVTNDDNIICNSLLNILKYGNSDIDNRQALLNCDDDMSYFSGRSDNDFDNLSETSSICSNASQRSFHGSQNSLTGWKREEKTKFGGESYLKNRKFKNTFSFGIKGFSNDTTEKDISDVFQTFGTVKHVNFCGKNSANVCLILSDENYSNTLIIGETVMIKNKEIVIEKCFYLTFQLPEFVLKHFSCASDFDNWTENLYKRGILLSKNITELTKIKNDIKDSYQNIMKADIVGSRASGLTVDDSPVDIFLTIDDNYFGKKTQDDLILKRHAVAIETALRKDTKFSDVKKGVVDLSPAVVNAKHKQLNLECRVFFRNGLDVEKTKLINTYLQFDEKIRKLILIVKEWSKHTKISSAISEYAITWMVLFYLLKGEKPVVPAVVILRNHNKEGRSVVAGWDCRFCKDISELPDNYQGVSATVNELLCGFFLFFAKKDIIKYIHCPLTGEQFLKNSFNKLHLPSAYNKYKDKVKQGMDEPFPITAGLCLQDPLELNINLTENLVGNELQKFRMMCIKTVNKLRCLNYV